MTCMFPKLLTRLLKIYVIFDEFEKRETNIQKHTFSSTCRIPLYPQLWHSFLNSNQSLSPPCDCFSLTKFCHNEYLRIHWNIFNSSVSNCRDFWSIFLLYVKADIIYLSIKNNFLHFKSHLKYLQGKHKVRQKYVPHLKLSLVWWKCTQAIIILPG